jgi:hypothetical protein
MVLPTGAAPEESVTGVVPTGAQPSADFAPQVVAGSSNSFPQRPNTGAAMAAFLNSLPEPGTTGASPEQIPVRTEVPTDPIEIAQTVSTAQDEGAVPTTTGSVPTTLPQSTQAASAEDVAFAKIMALSAHLGEPQDTLTSSQDGGDVRSVPRRPNVRSGVRPIDTMGYSPAADPQVVARIAEEEVPRVRSFFSQMPTSSTAVQPLAFG